MSGLIASQAGFSTSHIAVTAAITGVGALVGGVLLLGRHRSALVDSVVIAILATGAVFLWRKSANMPQLNDDGLPPFSANDWLAPVLTYWCSRCTRRCAGRQTIAASLRPVRLPS